MAISHPHTRNPAITNYNNLNYTLCPDNLFLPYFQVTQSHISSHRHTQAWAQSLEQCTPAFVPALVLSQKTSQETSNSSDFPHFSMVTRILDLPKCTQYREHGSSTPMCLQYITVWKWQRDNQNQVSRGTGITVQKDCCGAAFIFCVPMLQDTSFSVSLSNFVLCNTIPSTSSTFVWLCLYIDICYDILKKLSQTQPHLKYCNTINKILNF